MQRELGGKYVHSEGVLLCTPPTQKELYEARCPDVEYRAVPVYESQGNGIFEDEQKGETWYNYREGTEYAAMSVKVEPCVGPGRNWATPKKQIDEAVKNAKESFRERGGLVAMASEAEKMYDAGYGAYPEPLANQNNAIANLRKTIVRIHK